MNAGCPLCHTQQNKIVYDRLPLSNALIVQCGLCAHRYTLQNGTALREKLYSTEAYTLIENRRSFFDKILNWEYGGVINTISRLKPMKGSLIDFGCGKGKLGSIAKNRGWQVKAVETAMERASYAKDVYGLEVDTSAYAGGQIFITRFDVLTLFHVVEHLREPNTLLDELVRCNLNDDALVVIEVPNINSWQSFIAGNKWMHLDPTRHFHHFSAAALEKLAATLKLRVIKTHSFSFHMGVLGMVDTFLKRLGYKNNIIYELKNRNKPVMLLSAVLLPVALLLETLASVYGRGGVLRKYFVRIPEIN